MQAMGLLRMFGLARSPDLMLAAPRPDAQFSIDIPPEMLEAMTGGGAVAPRITRAEALQVPAVLRSRNLIAGTLGSLPHAVHRPDRREDSGWMLGGNIDPDVPNSVVLAQTYEDLLFEGIAWWRVTGFNWKGFPVEGRHVPVEAVHVVPTKALMPSQMLISPDQPFPVDGDVFIDGMKVDDREVIRFDSPNPPLLVHGARAIRTCLKLDRAAALYADEPLPLGYFSPTDGADPADDDDIEELLDKWEVARRKRAWGYVPAALTAKALSWNPEQLQLADQRQHAVLEIARAAGIDPEDLGVSTTSRTYQNSEQRRQDLTDFTLGAFVSAMQDRLSMRDVLPRGYKAKVKFSTFLRADTKTRMETYAIGLPVGAYVQDEIRELEDKPSITTATPSSPAPIVPASADPERTEERTMSAEPATVFSASVQGGEAPADHAEVTFGTDEVMQTFQVDVSQRTIVGLVVPWNQAARSGGARWSFAKDSLHWSRPAHIKLNRDHDRSQLIGRATHLQPGSRGLHATFVVASGADGDRALGLAADQVLDGFSVEIEFHEEFGDDWQPDPANGSVRLVSQATLRGVALTAVPAFDDARVESVAASRDEFREEKPHEREDGDGRQGRRRVRVRLSGVHH